MSKESYLKVGIFGIISSVLLILEVLLRNHLVSTGIYVFNPGISWGLGSSFFSGTLLGFVAAVLGLVLFIPYFLYKFPKGRGIDLSKLFWLLSGSLVVLGGSINLYDRVRYGAVLDYITFSDNFFLNLSDLYILTGTIIFVSLLVFSESKWKKKS